MFAVALSKSSGWITEGKLAIIESSMEEEAPARILVSFLWFWFIGACLVSLATAMVSPPLRGRAARMLTARAVQVVG